VFRKILPDDGRPRFFQVKDSGFGFLMRTAQVSGFSKLKNPGIQRDHQGKGRDAQQGGHQVDGAGIFRILAVYLGKLGDSAGGRGGDGQESHQQNLFAVRHQTGDAAEL